MRDATNSTEESQDMMFSLSGRVGLSFTAVAAFGALVLLWQLVVIPISFWPALLHGTHGLWIGAVLLFAHVLFTFTSQRLLACFSLSLGYAWPYRLAFLSSATVGVALWLYQQVLITPSSSPWQLVSVLMGCFLGGLLATVVDVGLWEDSFPPAPRIQDEVRRYHLKWIENPPPEPRAKRLFDLILAGVGTLLSAPFWMLSAFLIWFEDPGPVFFVKNSVGKGGINFRQIKFRSMIRDAEAKTGPIPAREGDERTLLVGRFLRKAALDELPQLINILRGEMSFVGPRPLRTVVIHQYLQTLPQFAERHKVRPGIAGLSQVIGGYYLTPLQRLRFDRIYVRHLSISLDLQILLLALLIVFWLRWGKEPHPPVPRRWVGL
ncbi:MAG: sugar transferase [Chloroflexota bacterium]|nr:sugar transferase [Chloroflexota bacterium]